MWKVGKRYFTFMANETFSTEFSAYLLNFVFGIDAMTA